MPLLKILSDCIYRFGLCHSCEAVFSVCGWKALGKQVMEDACRKIQAQAMARARLMNKGILFSKSTLWTSFCDFHGQHCRCGRSQGIPVLTAQRRRERAIQRVPSTLPPSPHQPEAESWLAFPLIVCLDKIFFLGHISIILLLHSVFVCWKVWKIGNAGKLISFPKICVLVKYMIRIIPFLIIWYKKEKSKHVFNQF